MFCYVVGQAVIVTVLVIAACTNVLHVITSLCSVHTLIHLHGRTDDRLPANQTHVPARAHIYTQTGTKKC